MSSIKTISVELSDRRYDITVGAGVLDSVGPRLRDLCSPEKATVITDKNVSRLYSKRVVDSIEAAGLRAKTITIEPGESSKSLEMAERLYDGLAERKHGRGDVVVALGGGVVGDIAGFVAATWMRGVPFVQCPTTLEAAIDAAVGGKTAINHPAGKNLVGAFHQPLAVICDVSCLETLDDRNYRAAMAESVKHAVIADPAFLDWHEANVDAIVSRDMATVSELITWNCRIKAQVVAADEREAMTGPPRRATLNFGHTIGHALEAVSRFDLLHGEAVGLGMLAELDLAVRYLGFPERDQSRIRDLVARLQPSANTKLNVDNAGVLSAIKLDKKASHGVRFAVPVQIGACEWLEGVSDSEILGAVASVIGRGP